VAILVCAGAAPRAKSILDEELDQKTIKMLVEQGQLLDLIYDDKGELVHRMCVVLVNAKPDVVWSAITDFQNYDKFVPGMEPPVIKDKKKNEVTVEFTLKINIIMGVSYTQTYSTRYVFKKPILYMYNPEEPKKEPNIWKLVPVDNGARTILYYYDTPPDLTKMGSLVAGVSKAKPEIALALQVSPISILLNQTKSYIEQKMK
jgi:ribosome-associated toxin RatA of RatAB toxin-antitoxin module